MEKVNGICAHCNESIKNHGKSIKGHLSKCTGIAEQKKKLKTSNYLVVKVESPYTPHWLLLKVHPNVLLSELDFLLRHGWLECCGHLSEFFLGRDGFSMQASVGAVFAKHSSIEYSYDFGSTTSLTIKKIDECEMPNNGNLILLMQNEVPNPICAKCDKKVASEICLDCLYDNEHPFYCDTCINKHGHLPDNSDYEESMPIVNSPRTGVCAYDGPVDFENYMPSKEEEKPQAKDKQESKTLYTTYEERFGESPLGGFDMFGDFEDDDEDYDDDEMLDFDPSEITKMMNDPQFLQTMQHLSTEMGFEIAQGLLPITHNLLSHYKSTGDKAMADLSEEDFFYTPNKHTHSIAAIVKHISIHQVSNWTNFLATDANKFRAGDDEFVVKGMTKKDILKEWEIGWNALFSAIESLEIIPDVLQKMSLNGHEIPIWIRLLSTTPHYTYHVGQIVQMAKLRSAKWDKQVFDTVPTPPKEEQVPKGKEISINRKKKK